MGDLCLYVAFSACRYSSADTATGNSRLPQWAQTELVNIFLFQADTGTQVLNFTDVPNPLFVSGVKHVQVDDVWFGARGAQWNGQNVSFPFYFVITRNDRPLDNSAIPQATFTAVREYLVCPFFSLAADRGTETTFADSIVASMSSSSALAAASSRSEASASASAASASAKFSGALTTATISGSLTVISSTPSGIVPPGSVQGASGGGSFPKWAIAVIVVLGFLALVASGILAFYIVRRIRQRRDGMLSHRNSMGSSTPMMANADHAGPQSPVLGGTSVLTGGALGAAAGYGAGAYSNRPSSPGELHDGASMTSRVSDAGPFSGADAAIMANAFRQALRKPDFADRPVEEGESPDDQPHAGATGPGHSHLINQELAEEGRDIRSVSSSRGVKVETLSDDDSGTVQNH